jgi:hypothetical protein
MLGISEADIEIERGFLVRVIVDGVIRFTTEYLFRFFDDELDVFYGDFELF